MADLGKDHSLPVDETDPAPAPPVDTEDQYDETDSTYGDDSSSYTQSLTSSVMNYEYEHGRRFHGGQEAGKYILPNDEEEAERLDLQHHAWITAWKGALSHAPLPENITSAIDIGTGTGIWAIEFADQHPQCQVLGTDLSPIQPGWVPPNCSFLIDDADNERDWIFEPTDYIHSRLVTVAIRNWPRYFKRCYETLKPGGWVELQEWRLGLYCDDDSASSDEPSMHWSNLINESTQKIGIDRHAADHIQDRLEKAGFTNITREDEKWPVGGWMEDAQNKRLGECLRLSMTETVNASVALLTRALNWSKEEADILVAQCRNSFKDDTKHRYVSVTTVYGQKPLDPPPSSSSPPSSAAPAKPVTPPAEPTAVAAPPASIAPSTEADTETLRSTKSTVSAETATTVPTEELAVSKEAEPLETKTNTEA